MARHHTAFTTLSSGALCAALLLGGCQRAPGTDGLIAEARQYRQKGETKAAVIQLKNALQREPNHAAARLLLGEVYLDAGDPLSAEKELRKAQTLGVKPIELMPALGKALLMLGQPEKVLTEIRLDPASPAQLDVIGVRAEAYLTLGDSEQARQLFNVMLKQRPDYAEALLGLARIAVGSAQLDEAAALIERSLAKQPGDIDSLRLKGDLLRMRGKNDEALRVYQQILALRPNSTFIHIDLANLHIQAGRFVDAKAEIDAARKSAPNSLIVLHAQALLDFREGKQKAALEALQQVLRAAPDHMPSLLLIGAVQLALGSGTQAEQYLKRFLDANPQHIYASKLLASVAFRNGKPERAFEILRPLLVNHPDDTELLALAGEAQMRLRQFSKAAEYFDKASQLSPQLASLHTALGVSRLGMGEYGRAIAELERSTAIDGKEARAGVILVMALLRNKEYDKALEAVKAMEQQQAANPVVYNLKGGVYLAKKDYAAARASFKQALGVEAAYLPALDNLAQLDLADKKPEQARKRYQAVLANNPKNAGLMTALAKLAAAQENKAEATRWLEKASKDNPDALAPAVLLGSYYLESGEVKKALALAQGLQASNPSNPEAMALLAQMQAANGNLPGALETYNKLAQQQTGSPDLYVRIAAVQMALNEPAGALQSVRRALSLQPDLLEAQVSEVALLLSKGSQGEALALARKIQQQRPRLPAGFKLEGDVLMAQNKPLAAVKLYEQAYAISNMGPLMIQIHRALMAADKGPEAQTRINNWLRDHPTDQSTRLYLAGAKLARKEYRPAIAQYEKILLEDPKHIVALNDLAWAYQQEKDPRALAIAERAYQQQAANPAVLDTLGWILLEGGSTARALPMLQKAVTLAPDAPEIRYHLGAALAKSGDKKTARQQLEQLLAGNKPFANRADAEALLARL